MCHMSHEDKRDVSERSNENVPQKDSKINKAFLKQVNVHFFKSCLILTSLFHLSFKCVGVSLIAHF